MMNRRNLLSIGAASTILGAANSNLLAAANGASSATAPTTCGQDEDVEITVPDGLNPPNIRTAGIRMVPVVGGKYKVWTKRIGHGPIKVLLLHGGSGFGHQYLEAMESFLPGVEWLAHRGSVGRIGDTCRLRIIGADGNDVAPGETGEIYFLPNDGPGSTYHYLGAEPKRSPDGWESLGDIGRLDADGYLYLGDRLADMILRGGANIYPAEVEAAVSEHPDVRSCVVVGLPDPEFGQRVHAILELDDDIDAQAIADNMGDFLSQRLSRYKHPESFERISAGPRDDSGKVRRTLLRDERASWLKENRIFKIVPSRAQVG
jgi:acyl-CoA synthetase (AMP-forming)/AMP-acid ligase II